MNITIHATPENKKYILDLIEEQGIDLPCNCHGANTCGGKQYDFPCNMIPHKDITVSVRSRKEFGGLSIEMQENTRHTPDTLLIDLGTTTVAMVFYNSINKTVFHSEVFPNPQIPYGADVISRIKYDVEFHSDYTLKKLICNEISKRYETLSHKHHIKINTCLIGGNTTMIHLLLGLPLDGMSSAPFTPSNCEDLHHQFGETDVIILPWLSAFIGGDILSGMLYLDFDRRDDTCILSDLGTNGELALLHNGKIYMSSTAAGPAFEGGGLSCGCPAVPGAISDVTLNKIMPKLQTIGNKLPTGICGSGAISILSQLISLGYMDSSGIVSDKFPEEGLLISRTRPSANIFFTKNDIRQMQLAIAAISAGIDALCNAADISVNEVEHLYLAGGLGYSIDIKKASITGLFSHISTSRITPVGNSCLHGLASLCRSTKTLTERTLIIKKISRELSLADDACFQEQFIRHMTYETISTL